MSDLIVLDDINDDQREILDQIEVIIQRSLENKDPYIALNACKRIVSFIRFGGIALARILYDLKQVWEKFQIGDNFFDVASAELGLHRATVVRYVDVWEMHNKEIIPEPYREQIAEKNIGEQIPIATAIKQGYELKEEDWKTIASLPDRHSIEGYIRANIKGKEYFKKGALQLVLMSDGSLVAWKDRKSYYIGFLNVESDDPTIQEAIERIVGNSAISRR